jgi:hypothetical protein
LNFYDQENKYLIRIICLFIGGLRRKSKDLGLIGIQQAANNLCIEKQFSSNVVFLRTDSKKKKKERQIWIGNIQVEKKRVR